MLNNGEEFKVEREPLEDSSIETGINFSEHIFEAMRANNGLPTNVIVERCGIKEDLVVDILEGRVKNPTIATCFALVRGLNINMENLLGIENENENAFKRVVFRRMDKLGVFDRYSDPSEIRFWTLHELGVLKGVSEVQLSKDQLKQVRDVKIGIYRQADTLGIINNDFDGENIGGPVGSRTSFLVLFGIFPRSNILDAHGYALAGSVSKVAPKNERKYGSIKEKINSMGYMRC